MLLTKKTVVVAGCGEIGEPIYKLSCGAFAQVIAEDPICGECEPAKYPVVALHVAIPGSLRDFVEIVDGYVAKYAPDIILVHSSTVPGTTQKLVENYGTDRVVHTQVHGKHKEGRMRRDMLYYPKFVATASDVAFSKAEVILTAMGHPPESITRLSSPLAGEIVKLLATTFFGYLIVWTQVVERLSSQFGVPYEELMSFTKLNTSDYEINNKFPGVIGGHCVMPNIAILKKISPCPLWDFMDKSNDMKKEQANG
jgi:hypothetical protein